MVMATVGAVPLLGLYKPLKGLGSGAAAVTSFEYGLDTLDWLQ